MQYPIYTNLRLWVLILNFTRVLVFVLLIVAGQVFRMAQTDPATTLREE